jgi:hypothetical protein
VPQRHGTSCRFAAQCDEKKPLSVVKQTCLSVGDAGSDITPPQFAAVPVGSSHEAPPKLGSKHPTSEAHWKHEPAVTSSEVRHACVVELMPHASAG